MSEGAVDTAKMEAVKRALDRAKELDWLDGVFSDTASVAVEERRVLAALFGWIGLNLARRAIVRLAELDGVDIEKELLPKLDRGRPVIVTPELMQRAALAAAAFAAAGGETPTVPEPKLIQ